MTPVSQRSQQLLNAILVRRQTQPEFCQPAQHITHIKHSNQRQRWSSKQNFITYRQLWFVVLMRKRKNNEWLKPELDSKRGFHINKDTELITDRSVTTFNGLKLAVYTAFLHQRLNKELCQPIKSAVEMIPLNVKMIDGLYTQSHTNTYQRIHCLITRSVRTCYNFTPN